MARALDLTGHRFGRLEAVGRVGHRGKKVLWHCICDCGGTIDLATNTLTGGVTKSCGCLKGGVKSNGWNTRRNIVGDRFGRLVVAAPAGRASNGAFLWLCRCDCGNETLVRTGNLRAGSTSSCGCLQIDRTIERHRTHGATSIQGPELGTTWMGMRQRCLNPNSDGYRHYGGRGISICDRWMNGDGERSGLECFIEDMGPKPSSEYSVDRIDVNGNYEPGNCRWATPVQQARNKRSTEERAM